jgi:hypothetical protein
MLMFDAVEKTDYEKVFLVKYEYLCCNYNQTLMFCAKEKYSFSFELINTSVLVDSAFLLERE